MEVRVNMITNSVCFSFTLLKDMRAFCLATDTPSTSPSPAWISGDVYLGFETQGESLRIILY